MCGIAGFVNSDPRRPADSRLLGRMTGVIEHRGPDDEGFYVNGNVALGATRLSIIDLAGGRQPLSNEDGTVWVAYNGEIYNFLDLRKTLISHGHSFRTKCDTEVLVHAYEEYGLEFVSRLQGMFGFALWDTRRRRLMLARDRVGIKPVYYAQTAAALVFGSEIKSLLEHPEVEAAVAPGALDALMTFEYNPNRASFFAGINKLPAGHYLIMDEGGVGLHEYWDASYSAAPILPLAEAIEELRGSLRHAVSSHLMSDVPLGVFLSGGLDSSAIVALMSESGCRDIQTFSIGFKDGEDYDELAHSSAVARHFGTNHHEFVLEPQAIEILPKLVWHLEEPIADEAALPLYFLAKLARDYVKVVLAGDGGDELFAGYNRYFLYQQVGNYTRLPYSVRKGLVEPAVRALPALNGDGQAAKLIRRAKKLMEVAYQPEERRFSAWNRVLSDDVKSLLYSSTMAGSASSADPFARHQEHFAHSPFGDPISRSQYVDLKSYLVDCLLLKSDKVTAAFSLECRVPLLDSALVDLATSLPASYKYQQGTTKYIFREAMKGLLPESIRTRPKQGFILPFGRWFKDGLMNSAREILLDRRSLQRGYFDPAGLRRFLADGTMDDRRARAVYALIMFETWNRVFIDERSTPKTHRASQHGLALAAGS